jgi:putative beta-lysine N-acetyltransferase
MQDRIERIGKESVIQHGEHNNRVYLIRLDAEDFPEIIERINLLARENHYTKLFCKVPSWAAPEFFSNGFMMEAHIPGFYRGEEDVFFMSKFLNSDRLLGIEHSQLEEFSTVLRKATASTEPPSVPTGDFSVGELNADLAEEIAALYRSVFPSYPFPIQDPDYIRSTMQSHVVYFGIRHSDELIALSSAEVDGEGGNAEMTDFATLDAWRGKKLSVILLRAMEAQMKKRGIQTLYTIARLNSIPMNKTFLREGYRYAGTLINNTNISGRIESMNVLYKKITEGV